MRLYPSVGVAGFVRVSVPEGYLRLAPYEGAALPTELYSHVVERE